MNIEELAINWHLINKGEMSNIDILPQQTCAGLVVWFYYKDSLQDCQYFLTVPMVKELLTGKNPKKVFNKYK